MSTPCWAGFIVIAKQSLSLRLAFLAPVLEKYCGEDPASEGGNDPDDKGGDHPGGNTPDLESSLKEGGYEKGKERSHQAYSAQDRRRVLPGDVENEWPEDALRKGKHQDGDDETRWLQAHAGDEPAGQEKTNGRSNYVDDDMQKKPDHEQTHFLSGLVPASMGPSFHRHRVQDSPVPGGPGLLPDRIVRVDLFNDGLDRCQLFGTATVARQYLRPPVNRHVAEVVSMAWGDRLADQHVGHQV